jgi:Cu(I)/Ag(I) efflux system membrane fusion protein/cobalt-zinc-cadmium efflux system membrane fusion protein
MAKRIVPGLVVLAAVAAVAIYATVGRRAQPIPTPAQTTEIHDHAVTAPAGTPRGPVELDTRRQQLIGVRTVAVQRGSLDSTIRLAGTVAVDETRQSEISTRVDGWIRDLSADFTGRVIRRGEPLFTLYSPDLVATQQEFLLALRGRSNSNPNDTLGREYAERLVTAARERLLRLDMSPEDVDQLERTGKVVEAITFRSPAAGTIVEKTAVRGMRVTAGQTLYRVADLSTVWVEAEAYEKDLAAMRPGVRATVTFDAYPQRSFRGRVSFVSPTVTPETRTARIRVSLANPGGRLKPNMLADVMVEQPGGPSLIVPADSVVNTGTEIIAFVAEGDGRFTPRRIRTGRTTADSVEVLSGLKEGDQVAASATFFLDSESQLRGALRNYERPPANGAGTTATTATLDITFKSDPAAPKSGDVTLIVTVSNAGQPVTDADVSVVLSMPAMRTMNMPAMRAETRLAAVGGGTYRGTGQLLTPGRWDVAVSVRRDGQSIGSRQFALIAR